MSRTIFLAVAALLAAPAFAQTIYKHVGPDDKVTYSDQPPGGAGRNTVVQPPPSTGHYVNQQPGGVQAPGTIPQAPLPNQPLPTANLPSGSGPSTIPSSAVPAPGSFESTPGRAPNTAGDRLIGVPADEQRIDRDAAQRNIMQGERAREAEAVRLNVPQGEAAREARDIRTNVPAGEAARERRDMQIGVPADEQAREREAVRLNQ
jgi:Domain of unknown function (DUF4124)